MSHSVFSITAVVLALSSAAGFAANPYPTVPLYLDQVTAKPNVAVLVDDSGSMVCQPSDTGGCTRDKSASFVNNSTTYVAKMRLAKTALNSLFSNNFDIARWSLFKFRTIIPSSYTSGGSGIFYTAGSSKLLADWNTTNGVADFTSAVNAFVPAGSTPSASAFYNVMQYFYGNSSYGANTYQSIRDSNNGNPYFWNSSASGNYSDSGQNYTSPIQYVCQKNFVIFVSDGQPNQENGDILTATATNPKDGQSYTISNYVTTKNLLTGYSSDVRNTTVVNYSAFYHDAGVVPNGKSKDSEGNTYDATTAQPITTYTIGLGLASGDTGRTVLQAMAEAGGGQYFDTSDQTSLTNALQSILNSIKTQTATNVPVVASKPTNPTDAIQATFYSGDWSGQLHAYSISSTTGLANLTSPIPVLFNSSSATRLANIFTSTGGSASGALYTSVSSDSSLNSYLSGGSPSGWRSRSSDKSTPSTLGDIIDSTPTPFGTTTTAGFAVGANDGMLHVFGRTTSNYTEVFSYIPRAVTAANLALLGSTTYGAAQPHLYFVNGNLTFNNVSGGDNQFSTSTTSVLTGGMAQGGQGLFALDISNTVGNPSLLTGGNVFGTGNVLWDHVPADSGFANLGYTFAKPVIAQVYYGGNKKWAMITGNGYDSTNKATTLMVIDLQTGAMLYEINTGTASNGLSSPAVLDVNNDKVADYVYAGDQSGNVWRFKLQTSSSTTTSVSKFFTAQANQPIVAAPAIYAIPGGGYMVYIGTGRMMYENTSYNDRTTVYPQSLYGIYDDQTKTNLTYSSSTFISDAEVAKLNGTASIDGSATSTASGKLGSSVVFRKTTTISDAATTGGLSVGPSGNRTGWVFNMDSSNGERMLYQPVVALGKLYFTTQVLKGSSLVCSNVNQQSGWVMALDLMTGGRPSSPAFDLNGDGKINTSTASPDGDMVTDGTTKIVPSGINYNIGIPSALSIGFTVTTVNLGDYTTTDSGQMGTYPYPSTTNTNEVLTFYVGGTGGSNGNVAAGKLIPPKSTSGAGRRIAWREIF
jgi:type IV pilus assembly protein PilY1